MVEEGSVLFEDLLGLEVGVVDKTLDLHIDGAHNLASPLSLLHAHGTAHEGSAGLRSLKSDEADLGTHAPLLDHALGDVGNLLEIVGGTGGNSVLTVDDLLGETSAEGDGKLRLEVLTAVHARLETGLLGGEEGKSTGTVGAGDDGDLLDLIVVGDERTDDGVAGLVVGDELVLAGGEGGGTTLLLQADHDAVDGTVDLLPADGGLAVAGGGNGGLVHEVLELRAGEAGSTTGDGLEVDIGLEGLATGVDAKDALTALEVGKVDGDLAIEPAGTEEGLIQNIDTVGSGNGNDAGVAIETVHLDKDLVDGLLTLIVATGETGTTLTTDGIDLINENDAGSILLGLAEDVTDTGGTDTDEHLDELGTRDGDEGNAGLTRDGLGQEGLTGTGRSVQDDTTGDAASVSAVNLGLLEEIDDLGKLELGTVTAGDVLEGDAGVGDHLDLGLGLAKSHGVAGSTAGHAGVAAGVAREEEEAGEEGGGQNKGLGQLTEASGVLGGGEDGDVNLLNWFIDW